MKPNRKGAKAKRPARVNRGAGNSHGPKIAEALEAMTAAGTVLPSNLRPQELHARIRATLRLRGYTNAELPGRHAIYRYFAAQRQDESQKPQRAM
jgi:hypothetical protein